MIRMMLASERDVQSISLDQPRGATDQRYWQVQHRNTSLPSESFANERSAACGFLAGPAPTRYAQSAQGILVGIGGQG